MFSHPTEKERERLFHTNWERDTPWGLSVSCSIHLGWPDFKVRRPLRLFCNIHFICMPDVLSIFHYGSSSSQLSHVSLIRVEASWDAATAKLRTPLLFFLRAVKNNLACSCKPQQPICHFVRQSCWISCILPFLKMSRFSEYAFKERSWHISSKNPVHLPYILKLIFACDPLYNHKESACIL